MLKEKLNRKTFSTCAGRQLIPAPVAAAIDGGNLPRSLRAIITAAKKAGVSLNDIDSPSFVASLIAAAPADADIAAIAAGFDGLWLPYLHSLHDSGVDLDLKFTEAA